MFLRGQDRVVWEMNTEMNSSMLYFGQILNYVSKVLKVSMPKGSMETGYSHGSSSNVKTTKGDCPLD